MEIYNERCFISNLKYIVTTGLNQRTLQQSKEALIKKHIHSIFVDVDERVTQEKERDIRKSLFFVEILDKLVLCGLYRARTVTTQLEQKRYSIRYYICDYVNYSCKGGFFFTKNCSWPQYDRRQDAIISPVLYFRRGNEFDYELLRFEKTYQAILFQSIMVKCHAKTHNSKKELRTEMMAFRGVDDVLFSINGLVYYDELPLERDYVVFSRKTDMTGERLRIVNLQNKKTTIVLRPRWAEFFTPYEYDCRNRLTDYVLFSESPDYRSSIGLKICFYISQNDSFAYKTIEKCVDQFGTKERLPNLFDDDSSVNYRICFRKTFIDVVQFVYRIIARSNAVDPVLYGCPLHDVMFVLRGKNPKESVVKIDTISAQSTVRILRKKYSQKENWELLWILSSHYGYCLTGDSGLKWKMYYQCENLDIPRYLPTTMEQFVGEKFNNEYLSKLKRPQIDVKWPSEAMLFRLVYAYYQDAVFHYMNSTWLGRQHLDVYIPSIGVAIEYQGGQHYSQSSFFGGIVGLQERMRLDEQKRTCCKLNGIILIEWSYKTPITAANLISQLYDNGIENIPIPDPFAEYVKNIEPEIDKTVYRICRYGLDGKVLESYANYQEASEATNASVKMIQKAVLGYNRSAGGFQWRRVIEEESTVDIEPLEYEMTNAPKGIYQVSFDGEIIATFNSIKRAEKNTGVNAKSIRAVLNGKQRQAGGFFWCYVEEDNSDEDKSME